MDDPLNEAETRAQFVDPALEAAGWGKIPGSRIRREYRITIGRLEAYGRRGRPEIADYVLMYRNRMLAVVEAKRYDLPHTQGLAQAKRYSLKLAARYAFSTNGRSVYGADMVTGAEGDLKRYLGPSELWNLVFPADSPWRDRFASVAFGGTWDVRYYQELAVNNVLEAIAAGRRRVLLTLATGTGKTMIAFQIAWKLYHSRWTLQRDRQRRPRILFLADRNILADQALNDFSSFPEDALVRIRPDEIRKRGKVPKNGSVFFTIFQTFMTGPPNAGEPSPNFGDYPPDFFDFIVIDECHRGGANDESNWRAILEYFSPAVQLGLTATPKRKDNIDTYAYFGEPVYTYSLKEGINDGFLTPFKVRQISSTLDEYVYTTDDNVIEGEVEAGRRYTEADFNRLIEIREREAFRVRRFMGMINQGDKTLVFCATQEHALVVRDLINQIKAGPEPDYCVRVAADDGELGEEFLRAFQDNEKTIPTILTTSQKLSTGVNARNVRNIVLLRPINSIIEFKQIIGRGTRLYDGKSYFTIYDFVKAHEHFSDPSWDGEPLDETTDDVGRERKPAGESDPVVSPFVRPRLTARTKVRLADGKDRLIQSMVQTTFWGPHGPVSAQQFLQLLFGTLPEFFKNEEELRAIWSVPDTRRLLMERLADKGFGREQLSEMQSIIDAGESDLFDVLAYVAFALPTQTRQNRAAMARVGIANSFGEKQRAFLEFVLGQYVREGVEELEPDMLSPLLKLRYDNAIADAIADLGDAAAIRRMFVEFQKYLYQPIGAP